ncbi:MAG: GNAT family N-acetyltransferase, partial [Rudaea sp.]
DFVSRLLSPEARAQWLGNCFEFVELAVLPSQQGQGIGGQLHDALLEGVPYRTAVLSTYSGENRAMQLYIKRGWKRLVDELTFPGSTLPMVVLGLALEK